MNEQKTNKSLGELLLDAGKLKLQDIELIEHCQKQHNIHFGEAAVNLGLVTETDILQMLGQQFNYPYLQVGEGGFSEELIAAYQPYSSQVETLRGLRSQLILRWPNKEHKQLAVISSSSQQGCSNLVANLAIVFSQLGQRTVLVDANLRDPRQHKLFNLAQQYGLSELLVGRAGMDTIYKIPSFVDLSVLPSGAIPPNPQELLGRPTFKSIMHDLARIYEVTLLDTPNGMLYADMQNIVAETGFALIVMRKHHTRIKDTLILQNQIANAKAQIVGVVLNEF